MSFGGIEGEETTAESPTADSSTYGDDYVAGSPPAGSEDVTPDSSAGSEGQDQSEGGEPEDYKEGLHQAVAEAVADIGSQSDDVDPEADKSGEGEEQSEGEQGEGDGQDQEDSGETDENGEKLPPFHKHPRWQEMVRDRNRLREEVSQYKDDAEEFGKIQSFMQENGLEPQQVAQAIQLAAMVRNDPAQAREALSKQMEQLDQFVGEKLPEDLQREVEDGYISEERAKEVARLRNERNFTRQQAEEQRHRAEQTEQEAEQQRRRQVGQQALRQQQDAVRTWETNLKTRDPDFDRIQPLVHKELRLLVQDSVDQGRPPRTPDDAVKLAEKAYGNVKEQVRKLSPRDEARPGPSSRQSGGSAGGSDQPSSIVDAALRAASTR